MVVLQICDDDDDDDDDVRRMWDLGGALCDVIMYLLVSEKGKG